MEKKAKEIKTDDAFIPFNINHRIKVRLTDLGYQHLADIYNKYVGTIPSFKTRKANHYKNLADDEGYTEFQMWSFMQDFGEKIYMGGPLLFETTILINTKE